MAFNCYCNLNASIFPGESGLGKSTLINSLFLTDIYVNSAYEDAAAKFGKTMEVRFLQSHELDILMWFVSGM